MSIWKKLFGGTGTHSAPHKVMTSRELFQKGVNYRAEKNWTMAADCIRKAADMDHAEAQFNYALMCMRGDGVTKSDSEGVYWMKKSADNGFEQARKNVAILRQCGRI